MRSGALIYSSEPTRFYFLSFISHLAPGHGSSSRPESILHQSNLNAFLDDDAIARLRISEAELGLDLGARNLVVGEFRIGAYRGSGRARLQVGDPDIADFKFDTGGLLARLRFDTRDDAQFPRSGLRADLDVERVSAGTWCRRALRHGRRLISTAPGVVARTAGNSVLATQRPSIQKIRSRTSSPWVVSCACRGWRGVRSAVHTRPWRNFVYYRRVGESAGGLLDVPIYVGVSAEAGNVWQSRSDISFSSAHD